MMQMIFLVAVLTVIYFAYPKAEAIVNGNSVNFNSINANVIIISENPDFSNPSYINVSEKNNVSFILEPGEYYWKSDNGIIESWKNKFTIKSEVGLKIKRNQSKENESELVNIGNVKLNITKGEDGVIVGHVILSPDESEKIEDSGNYTGRQTE